MTFVNPFSQNMWIFTGLMILFCGAMLTFTYGMRADKKLSADENRGFTLSVSIFISVASLFQQGKRLGQDEQSSCLTFLPRPLKWLVIISLLKGTDYEPKRLSTKIVFLSIFTASIVIFAAYSASLTSFLAVYKVNMPFDTIQSM